MEDCIFCLIASGKASSCKVYETDAAYAFFDINAMNPYHTLVIPKQHYINIFDVPEEVLFNVMSCLKFVVNLYHNKLDMQNVQVINSSGPQAQQEVLHLHFHIAPRFTGDGQNIIWKTHPDIKSSFDGLLKKIGIEPVLT